MNPGATVRSVGPQESVTVASAPPQLSKAADGGTVNEFNGDEEIRSLVCLLSERRSTGVATSLFREDTLRTWHELLQAEFVSTLAGDYGLASAVNYDRAISRRAQATKPA